MDARQLTYFLAVVEHMNYGRAAEQLHMAQPSLSQAISTLEREVGVPLFHRVGRGIVLSDAGSQLIEPARRVLRELDAAKAAARSTRALQRGNVELVSMPSPGIEPLTSLTRDFTRRHPAMTLSIIGVFNPEEVTFAVKSGRAEVGLIGAERMPSVNGLTFYPLEDQPLVLLSPPDDGQPSAVSENDSTNDRAEERTDDAETIDRHELSGLRLVVSREGSLMRRLVDDVLRDGVRADIVVEVEHRTSILPMVLDGIGHAVMPSSWTPLARRTGVRVRRIEPVSFLRVAAVTRPGPLTPAATAFMQVVAAHAERTHIS